MHPAPDDIPVLDDDPFSEETLADPSVYQARLRCVGMHVAKLEAQSLVRSMVERVKSFSLAGEPTYKLNNTVRSLATLPVTVEI